MLYHRDGMRSSDLLEVVLFPFHTDVATLEGEGD